MEKIVTCIDYYLGAYGKTIIIFTCSTDWLILLKGAICRLLNDEVMEVDICKLSDIKSGDSIDEFVLYKIEKSIKQCISTQEKKPSAFVWKQDKEEIITLVGLIDGLLEGSGSGHQYLTNEDSGFVVELSLNEWVEYRKNLIET